MITTLRFPIHEVEPYINWLYFFYSWQLPSRYGSLAFMRNSESDDAQWLAQFSESEQSQAREALRLFTDAKQMLRRFDLNYATFGRVGLFGANGDGDDILVYLDSRATLRLPCLRQQQKFGDRRPNLCLSDFVAPLATGSRDTLGVFAVAVQDSMEHDGDGDVYRQMLARTLCDRLAEATAELLHVRVRRELWGYSPDEHLTLGELFQGRYQGIRPAVGYPSLPDQSLNFLLDRAIDFASVGISLTENGAMSPHGSVSGLMIGYPQARYFSVGRIGDDQFNDYVKRRGLPRDRVAQFLRANL